MTYTEIKNQSKTDCGFVRKQRPLDEPENREELIELEQEEKTDNVQALIFDFDGVLVSFKARFGWPLMNAIKDIKPGISRQRVVQGFLNGLIHLTTEINIGAKALFKIIIQLGKDLGLSTIQTINFALKFSIYYLKNKSELVPIIGIREVLRELFKNDFKIALVTNSGHKTIRAAKKLIPELNLFDMLITRDDVPYSKPDPTGFKRVIKEFAVRPNKILSIGDQASDIILGKELGLQTISITGDYGSIIEPHIKEYRPDYLLDDIRDLPHLIKQINNKKILKAKVVTCL